MSNFAKHQYLIEKSYKPDILQAQICVRMNEGWELVGGLTVWQEGALTWYAQALTKKLSILQVHNAIIDEEL